MPSITFAIGTQTKTFTVSTGNITRVVDALKILQGPIVDSGTGLPRPRTNAEVFDTLANNWMQALKDVVKSVEGEAAAATAKAAVADVAVT